MPSSINFILSFALGNSTHSLSLIRVILWSQEGNGRKRVRKEKQLTQKGRSEREGERKLVFIKFHDSEDLVCISHLKIPWYLKQGLVMGRCLTGACWMKEIPNVVLKAQGHADCFRKGH